VAAGALAGLATGDAVVFDGVPACPADAAAPWAVRLVVGEHAADGVLAAGPPSALTVSAPFRAAARAATIIVAARAAEKETEMEPSSLADEAARALAAAQIEVVAEVGRVHLRGDELLGLSPGTVLALGGARTTAVTLRIGGEAWAQGELVNVDGELGVRVTAVSRRP
jgi:flagellar motor switch/type III secretory pathway protein FliN